MSTTSWVIVYEGGGADTAMLRDLLEGAGIPATLGDEIMGVMAPYEIAHGTTAAIKVLVPDDRLEDARPVVVEFARRGTEAPPPGGLPFGPWECPCCHEQNDGTFDICWNCQTVRIEGGSER
jgi:hypothetical protein